MKHAIILGHPIEASFAASVAHAYRDAIEARGATPMLRDLYRLGFDPRLNAKELPSAALNPGADVVAERAAIADADVFVFVYPLWFNAPPAIVVGYVQRVFGMGFGYAAGLTGNKPLLMGRKMLSFTSSGAPTEWLQKEGGWDALRTLFDTHIAGVCGFEVLDHRHFGHVVPGTSKSVIDGHLAEIRAIAQRVSC